MSATAVTDEVLRQRLMRFYEAYAPDKIANVDKVVDLYRHRVPELFASLEEKYGPEPSSSHAHGSRSAAGAPGATITASHPEAPEELATYEQPQAFDSPRSAIMSGSNTPRRIEKKRSIRFAAPSEAAEESPAAAPPVPAAAAAAAVLPEAVPEAAPAARRPPPPIPPLAVQQHESHQPEQHKHQPPQAVQNEPAAQQQPSAAPSPSPPPQQQRRYDEAAASPMEDEEERPLTPHNIPPIPDAEVRKRERVKQRLIAFYQHYAPEKVASVDVALSAYRGREGAMFSLLEAKYGSEAAVYDDEGDNLDEAGKDQRRLRQMINASIAASPHARSAGMGEAARKADAPAFDHVVAAQLLGSSVDLQMFGQGSEKFAAAFVLMLHAIGPNALFDATHAKLPMPALPDREPSALDRFAFERILHFRFVWIDAWFKGLAIRNHELADRRAIADEMAATLRETRYREYVRVQAVAMINPIEADRRQLIQQEQALRYSGLLTWFRKNRDELLLDKIRATADVIISSPKQDASFAASPMRNVLTQEQSEVQKVLRSAGEALRRSTNRRPSASPNSRRAPSPNAAATSADRRVAGASPMASTRGASESFASPTSPSYAGGFSARNRDQYPQHTSQRQTSPERRGVSVALSLDMTPHHHQRDARGSFNAAPALSTARSPAASSRFATHRSDADPRASSPHRTASTGRSASAAAAQPAHSSSMSFLTRARRVAGARGQFSNHGGANSPAASRRSVSSRSVSAASTAAPPLY